MVRLVATRLFGVSTRLYHHQRLSREHLLEIAAHGFETVELFAAPTHVEYHNPAVVADLQQWLAEAGLGLPSAPAPAGAGTPDGAEHPLVLARPNPGEGFATHAGGPRDGARRGGGRLA